MINPASAAVPVPVMKVMGTDFYSRCTNPTDNGQVVVAICAAYVAGIADDMKYESAACPGPRANAQDLLPYVLNWMRLHSGNGAFPAAIQIRTGLHTMFPCRPVTAAAQRQTMSLGQALDLGKQFFEFWKAAGPVIMAVLH